MNLNLPNWVPISSAETVAGEYRVRAVYTETPGCCIHCLSPRLYRHGARRQVLKDVPQNGRRVSIVLYRARYRCRACGRTFLQPLGDDVPRGRQMTHRLVRYIAEQSAHRTYVAVADECGVSEKTVRTIAHRLTLT